MLARAANLGIGMVMLSVRNYTRAYSDETKEHTADIRIPHKRVGLITLVFLTPTAAGGRCPFPPVICT